MKLRYNLIENLYEQYRDLGISHNAALRCERRLAILERSENAKRCESLLNALLDARSLSLI